MTFKRLWLYEKVGDDEPRKLTSVLAVDPNTVISAEKLMEWTGKKFFLSEDGSPMNLREVRLYQLPSEESHLDPTPYQIIFPN